MQGIRCRDCETFAGSGVVLQTLQLGCSDVQSLPSDNRALPRLIIDQLASIDAESRRNRTIKQVWFGKAKHDVALQAPDVGLYRQGLAQPKEIVGAVAQSDERAGQAAYAAGKPDLIFAPLVDLQRQIHQPCLLIQMAVGDVGIVRFQLLKEAELIEPLQAQFP